MLLVAAKHRNHSFLTTAVLMSMILLFIRSFNICV